MTIAQYVHIARQPNLYTADQVEDARQFWNRKAFWSADDGVSTAARIWGRMCADALQAKEG